MLADVAPMISNTAPRSQTCVAMIVAPHTSAVVSTTCAVVLMWCAALSCGSAAVLETPSGPGADDAAALGRK